MFEQVRFDLKKNIHSSTNVVVFVMLLILMLGTFFTALGTHDTSATAMYTAYVDAGNQVQKTIDTLQKKKHRTAAEETMLTRRQQQHDYLASIMMAYAGMNSPVPTGSDQDVTRAELAYAKYNLRETKAGRGNDLTLVTYAGKKLDATLLGRQKDVAFYSYLVIHHVKEIPASKTDAPAAAYLSYTFLYHVSPLLLLGVVAVLMGQLATSEKRDGTINFINVLPSGKGEILTARILVTLILTLPLAFGAALTTYLLAGIKFGWGSWQYPLVYSTDGHRVAIMALGHFIGVIALLFLVAVLFLTVLSALIGLFSGNFGVNLIGLGAMILSASAAVLGNPLLHAVAPFWPASYFDFSNIVLHQTHWPILGISSGVLVVLGWSLAVYGVSLVVVKKRETM